MITVNLKGGLGNQMFQYAAARRLCLKHDTDLVLNTEFFGNIPKGDVPRKYQLNIFNIYDKAKTNDRLNPLTKLLQKIQLKILGEEMQIRIANILLKRKVSIHLNGYFQSEKYFRDIRQTLLSEFTLRPDLSIGARNIESIIRSSNSVCINIRRSDYLRADSIKLFGLCDMGYYNKAVDYIKNHVENPTFIAFSDDPDWTKNEFKIDRVVYAGNDILKDYEQMYLMSICKHNIIANSTFSWWGAWLNKNPNKIVIAPKQWFANKTADELGILPETWLQI